MTSRVSTVKLYKLGELQIRVYIYVTLLYRRCIGRGFAAYSCVALLRVQVASI